MFYRDVIKRVPKCDTCGCNLQGKAFVDGKTVGGPWANMCLDCHRTYGLGVGVDLGQVYDAHGYKVA